MNPISMMQVGMPLYLPGMMNVLQVSGQNQWASIGRYLMRKHKVVWTETYTVDVQAASLSEAKKLVNEMKLKDLKADPSYTVDISGLPRDTSKK